MYAAGHPPLPSIEIETFIAAMPAHSRKLEEKGDFEYRQEFIANLRPGAVAKSPDGLPRTKGVLVGGIIALRESLQMFAMQSGTDKGPEFAMYDCQACHHELRSPAWRQSRTSPGQLGPGQLSKGRPGRPRLPEWPAILALVGIAQVESDSAAAQRDLKLFQDKLQELAAAFDERPFGGSDKVLKLIQGNANPDDGLLGWLDKKAQLLSARSFSPTDANRALFALYELGSAGDHDFHSARQIAWAIRAIETEARLTYPIFPERVAGLLPRAQRQREENDIKIWRDWRMNDWKSADDKSAAFLEKLNDPLRLTLPAGQKGSIGDSLTSLLESSARYNPETFRELLREAARQSGRAPVK
jgi:hypothetical protein